MSTCMQEEGQTHLLATLSRGEHPLAYQTLDLAGNDASWLAKELGYLAAANSPDRGGQPWQLRLRIVDNGLRMEAWDQATTPLRLATKTIPLSHLTWIGMDMAGRLGIDMESLGELTFQIAVLDSRHELIQRAASAPENADFVIEDQDDAWSRRLRLPNEFSREPLSPSRTVLRDVPGSFVCCVITEGLLQDFASASAAECEVERAFGAPMRIHLAAGRCYLVLERPLVEITSENNPHSLTTRGRHLFQLHRRFGGKFAYLHFHPRTLNDVQMTPTPSGPDVAVAKNLASTAFPVCMPIALWGARHRFQPEEIAVHSFVDGTLSEVPLEVLTGGSV